MTAEEANIFGEALAERYVQVEEKCLAAVARYKKVGVKDPITFVELQQSFIAQEYARARFELFSEIIDTLPLDVQLIFFERCKQIKGVI